MNEATIELRAGTMTWWTLCPETDPEKLADGLDALGMPKMAPNPRTWLMSLKAAMCECFDKPEELVRSLDKKQQNGYVVELEEKGVDDNCYSKQFKAAIDSDGHVLTEGWDDRTSDLQSLACHYRRVLPAASVSKMLTDVITSLHGQSLKASGGLYYLPESAEAKWAAVVAVVEGAACRGHTNDLTVCSMPMTAQTARDLKRSITQTIRTESARIAQDLANQELGAKALSSRLTEADSLRDLIREYEDILNDTLSVCHEHLDTALKAGAVADAIQEHDDIFAT